MFNKLYKSRYYPIVPQTLTLVVFMVLIIGSIGITTDNMGFAKQLRNTNLSNLIVWSYWWPLIVVSAVFLGRHWCSICPIELISAITTRFGLNKKLTKPLNTGWAITILYAFVAVVAIHTWGIHRIPRLMAFYLLSLMTLSTLLSLIFEKRAFCSYFCPVGKLLGLYALLAPLRLTVKSQDVCKSCKTKDCISKRNEKNLIGRSCQSNLYPANIDDNRDCILCTQCVKVCTHDNITIHSIKKSFISFDLNRLSLSEVGMIVMLTGFVSYEILSSWKISKGLLLAPSKWLFELLSIENLSPKLFEGVVLFLILPFTLYMIIASLSKAIDGKPLGFHIRRLAGHLLPVVAFGHVFKALLKTTSRIPYWEYAIKKPNGLDYAAKILNGEIALSIDSWINTTVIALGIVGLFFSLYISMKKLNRDSELKNTNKIVIGFLTTLYFLLLLGGPVSGVI